MRSIVAAVLVTTLIAIGHFGAPVAPVALGAGLGFAWWFLRARRRPPTGRSALH